MEKSDELYEVYAEFGMAAEKAQCVELADGTAALVYVTMLIRAEEIDDDVREWHRQLLKDADKRTLGNLLKLVKSTATFKQNTLDVFEIALERRNYLMHRFFPANSFAIFSESGRREMIEELRNVRRDLSRAEAILDGIAHTTGAIAGRESVTQEMLDRFIAKGARLQF